jgi:hypothetical protein
MTTLTIIAIWLAVIALLCAFMRGSKVGGIHG